MGVRGGPAATWTARPGATPCCCWAAPAAWLTGASQGRMQPRRGLARSLLPSGPEQASSQTSVTGSNHTGRNESGNQLCLIHPDIGWR